MDDFALYLALVLFLTSSLITIFQPDIRDFLLGKILWFRTNNAQRFNGKLEERIALINDLSESPSAATGYLFRYLFMAIVLLAFVIFHGFMIILGVNLITSVLGFFVFWIVFLIFAAMPIQVAGQLQEPGKSIARLNEKRKNLP